jgi:hypothetical protein
MIHFADLMSYFCLLGPIWNRKVTQLGMPRGIEFRNTYFRFKHEYFVLTDGPCVACAVGSTNLTHTRLWRLWSFRGGARWALPPAARVRSAFGPHSGATKQSLPRNEVNQERCDLWRGGLPATGMRSPRSHFSFGLDWPPLPHRAIVSSCTWPVFSKLIVQQTPSSECEHININTLNMLH